MTRLMFQLAEPGFLRELPNQFITGVSGCNTHPDWRPLFKRDFAVDYDFLEAAANVPKCKFSTRGLSIC